MDELTRTLGDFVRTSRAPAVVGAVVDRNGHLRCDAIGLDRRGAGAEPVAIDDRWHIGSCAKSMTAVLWACLVEAGLADWSLPIREIFGDVAKIDPGWSEPTIDDLLLCRAGVAPNPPARQMARLWSCPRPETEQRTEAARTVLADAPHDPGQFRYSNLGYVIVGAAIDRIAGVPFERALRLHVLDPLGIESLGFGPPPRVRGHGPRVRIGPILAGRGAPADPDDPRSDNPSLLTPAGRMHLTIADWARFQRIFLDGGRPLLSRSSVDRILDVPPGDGDAMAMGWARADALGGSFGMQGSNTAWAATALIDRDMTRTAMVVANDGRTKVLRSTAFLTRDLLSLDGSSPDGPDGSRA